MKILALFLLVFGTLGFNDRAKFDLPGTHNCDDPTYFEVVKKYIEHEGDSSTFDISGNGQGGVMVTYHSIYEGDWKMTVDNGPRIYFSFKDRQLGNILWEKDINTDEPKVSFELRYFESEGEVDEEVVEQDIRALYCKLIDRASSYK